MINESIQNPIIEEESNQIDESRDNNRNSSISSDDSIVTNQTVLTNQTDKTIPILSFRYTGRYDNRYLYDSRIISSSSTITGTNLSSDSVLYQIQTIGTSKLEESINSKSERRTTYQSFDQEIERNIEIKRTRNLAGVIFIIIFVFYSAFVVCDLYYGLNDTSCAIQNVKRISFNLKTFFIIRSLIILSYLIHIVLSVPFITKKTIENCRCYQISILIIVSLFLSAWNIIGAIIFWKYIDNSKCSIGIYNYTFISLIIIFTFNIMSSKIKSFFDNLTN